MWLDIPQDGVLPVSHSDNSLDNLKEFEEAFINGMPSYFHPLSDDEGLEVIRRVLKTRI
jgi:hypothetical protein